jgi:hypothetical protein
MDEFLGYLGIFFLVLAAFLSFILISFSALILGIIFPILFLVYFLGAITLVSYCIYKIDRNIKESMRQLHE